MQEALNILGYNCWHSPVFYSDSSQAQVSGWSRAQDAKFYGKGPVFTRADWNELLGSFSAVSADAPSVGFAEELITTYPEAKVLLVERDIETWYRSFNALMSSAFLNWSMHRAADLDPF